MTHVYRRPKQLYRHIIRGSISLIILLLPLSHDLNSLQLIGLLTTLLWFTIVVETWAADRILIFDLEGKKKDNDEECPPVSDEYKGVVALLLEKGAEVNAKGGYYGNALQAASARGHQEVVALLLEKGAEVNAQGGHYGNALQAALVRGHQEVVACLLAKGAEVSVNGEYDGNALRATWAEDYRDMIEFLQEKAAQGAALIEHYHNVLQKASVSGDREVVESLLKEGAQGGHYGNALQAASARRPMILSM